MLAERLFQEADLRSSCRSLGKKAFAVLSLLTIGLGVEVLLSWARWERGHHLAVQDPANTMVNFRSNPTALKRLQPLSSTFGHRLSPSSLARGRKPSSRMAPHTMQNSVITKAEKGGAPVIDKPVLLPGTPDKDRQKKKIPKWRVLLLNDPVNKMEYVVQCLKEIVPSLSVSDAMQITMTAHTTGVGLVIVCEKEYAETYRDQIKGKGMFSTIEPEDD